MNMDRQNTDEAILTELGLRLTQIRLSLNLTQAELAERAAVAKRTIERIETGRSVQTSNLVRILRALGLVANLNLLLPPIAPSPIEQLQLRGKTRRRASSMKAHTSTNWSWGSDK